ncbi:MAG: histidine phosphatase family protein [Chitinophagaceae bacterium]|nr:histidine phosphatase family protein [Chitinophagaceae bacterium]MCW5927845.1 histidine phosphatase family protein [Chitinophagaceae bacterium]
MKYLRHLLILFCWSLAFHSTAQEGQVTKVILVRHAEKADDGTKDPPLSEAGKNRAVRLAKILSDIVADALYATPYKRTKETLAPLSNALKIPVSTYPPPGMEAIEKMVHTSPGKTIVIAGHSNTIPPIVNRLIREQKFPELEESEYGKIWVLLFDGERLLDCSVYNY